ncbi:MAG TPA: hypothetical protein VES03_06835 [Motilibacterales bacterium]|nr:hypothetical protein [Motilibacterales bacterium]
MRTLEWGRTIHRRDLAWAALVAALAMGIALAYRSALVPTDPWHYVQGALAFPEGTWRPSGLSRWGFLLPIIPFARLWGDATATYYVVPVLSTGVLAAVLYLLGTRYVSRSTGVLAAVFALGTPLVFVNLTRGYTDLTATTLIGLALLLATLAADAAVEAEAGSSAAGWTDNAGEGVDAAGGGPGGDWGRRVPALLAACGFVTGWSFEVRETAIFAWPVIGLVLWGIGRPRRTMAWFAPPALAWLILDALLCAVVYGDPLLKFRIILGADISTSEVSSDAAYMGQSRLWYVTVLPRSILEVSGGPALLACLAVGAVGGVVFRAQLGRIWAWGMLTLALLWVQGGPLDPAHPSVRLDVARYWLSFIVPLMLVAVGTSAIVIRSSQGVLRMGAAVVGGLLALGVVVPAVRFATDYPGFAPNGGAAMVELREHLGGRAGIEDARIWADWGTQRVLPVYQAGPFGDPRWAARRFRSLNRLLSSPAGVPRAGDYVVIYSAEDRTCWHCRRALQPVEEAFGPFPGAGWDEMFTSSTGNLSLYLLEPSVVWPKPTSLQDPPHDVEDGGAMQEANP